MEGAKTYHNLETRDTGNVRVITISREEKYNALNLETLRELSQAIQAAVSAEHIKGIIITGAGQKAFVAGADISEFTGFTPEQGLDMARLGHSTLNSIENSPKPVLACINGFALGGGCELAMACHLRIASENAQFGQPEVKLGIIAGYGGTQRLTRLIGKTKAMELLLAGTNISAQEAAQLGLLNNVVPQEKLMETGMALMEKITANAPYALAKTIECVNNYHNKKEDSFSAEQKAFSSCLSTEDFREGTQAFLAKRKAEFRGR